MDTLLEFIFRGESSKTDLSFLEDLLKNNKELRFNYPEGVSSQSYEEISKIFKTNDYVDFVISTDHLNIENRIIKYVFINLGLDNNQVELLFFFDIKDLNIPDLKQSLDFVNDWMSKFKEKYGFESFVCQIENANKDEYFFDNEGLGPFYNKVNKLR